jgi:hypothetical protein
MTKFKNLLALTMMLALLTAFGAQATTYDCSTEADAIAAQDAAINAECDASGSLTLNDTRYQDACARAGTVSAALAVVYDNMSPDDQTEAGKYTSRINGTLFIAACNLADGWEYWQGGNSSYYDAVDASGAMDYDTAVADFNSAAYTYSYAGYLGNAVGGNASDANSWLDNLQTLIDGYNNCPPPCPCP